MVVFECSGAFTPPTYPKFTEPPDAEKVKESGASNVVKLSNDPLKAEKKEVNAGKQVINVAGLYLAGGTVEKDPAASNGSCLRIDKKDQGVVVTHAIFRGLTMGHYRVTCRAKLKAEKDDEGISADFHLSCYIPLRGTAYVALRGVDLNVKEWTYDDFKSIGKYEDFSGDFDFLGDSSQINALVRWNGNGVVYLDTITFERLSSYTDIQVIKKLDELGGRVVSAAPEFELGKQGGGRNILVINGLYHDSYHIPEALARLGKVIDVTPEPKEVKEGAEHPKKPEAKPPPAKMNANAGEVCVNYVTVDATEENNTLSGYPEKFEELCKYDAVILINADASWFQLQGRIRLRDFVKAGGGLLVLGGNFSLGQGQFSGTFLEDLLPVTVAETKDVQPSEKPLPLKPGKSLAGSLPADLWKDPACLYWRHIVKPKTGANVDLLAGNEPVLFSGGFGKGRVVVFTGTVLGEPVAHEQPFWQWNGWPQVMGRMISWLAQRNP